QSRRLDRRKLFAWAAMGQDPRSGRTAEYASSDRHVFARRVDRSVAEGRTPDAVETVAVVDHWRDRDGGGRLFVGAAIPDREIDLDLVIRAGRRGRAEGGGGGE